jgi:hypothetical protein
LNSHSFKPSLRRFGLLSVCLLGLLGGLLPGRVAAQTGPAPSIDLRLLQVTDLGGLQKVSFRPGETARVWLQATNTGGDASVAASLLISDDRLVPFDYDSYPLGEDQLGELPAGGSFVFTFDWTIPQGALPGWYDLFGYVKDQADSNLIYDDTEAGANTTGLGASAWLDNQIEILPWTYPYSCYRAQLHAHSSYSNGKLTPLSAYSDARSSGVQAFALTDHDYMLTATEWTKTGNYALQSGVSGQYVALRGFEWTHTYLANGTRGGTYGEGHANVINSRDLLVTPDYTSLGRAPTEAEARADLKTYYEWVANAVPTSGTRVIGQFNHPSGGLTVWRFDGFAPPWWVNPTLRRSVIDRFALFELETGVTSPYYGPTWDPGNGITNEMLYKQALNNGWRVAPAMNEDNHTKVIVATPHRDGVWAADLTNAGILEALQARRTFASEDGDFQLAFSGNGSWMGSVLSLPDGGEVNFHFDWQDPDDAIAFAWLVASPGTETPISLAGKNLFADAVDFSHTVQPGDWYYIKIRQADGDLIYSAPIWIAPLALIVDAGPDKIILPGTGALLEGSAVNGRIPYSYAWSPTAGLNDATVAQPTATPAATTTYSFTVTDAVGQTGSADVTLQVITPLTVDAGPAKLIIAGGGAILEGTASGGLEPYTYSWNPTEGLDNPTSANPLARPTTTTIYSLTVTDALGNTGSDTTILTVASPMTVEAGPDKIIGAGGSAVLIGGASGGVAPYGYSWTPVESLNDPNIANPTASPSETTVYTLNITDALGQSGSDTATVTVAPPVVADAGADKEILQGQSALLEGSGSGGLAPYTYTWTPAEGLNDSTLAQPLASPATTTTYTLTLTDALGQTGNDTVTVTVASLLTAEAGPDKTIVNGGSALLEGSGSGGLLPYGYAWTPTENLNDAGIARPTASPAETKQYTLTVTDASGQTSSDSVTVTIASPVSAEAGPDKTIAAGGSAQLEGAASGGLGPYTYSWTPTSGLNNASLVAPTASPAETTLYTLTVTDALGQSHSDTMTVTVASPVIANAGSDKIIAAGGSAQLEGAASGGIGPYTYSWTPAAGLGSPNALQTNAAPAATTTYALTVTDALGQTNSDEVVVTVASAAIAEAGPDKYLAVGGNVLLQGSASGGLSPYLYSWHPTEGLSDPAVAQPTASPAATTVYTLTVTDALGQSQSDTMTATVVAPLVVEAGPDKTIPQSEAVQLEGGASGGLASYSYTWTPSTGLSDATIAQPLASPASTTIYTLTVTDALGQTGSDTATVNVTVSIPAAPSNLIATTASTFQINLSWNDDATTESGFSIERKLGATGAWSEIATVGANVTTYQNSGLLATRTYYYRVRAYNGSGNSAYSNEVIAVSSLTVPRTPGGVTAKAVDEKQINLSWSDNSTDEFGFCIDRKTGDNGIWAELARVGENVTTYVDTSCSAATGYYYRLRSYNSNGYSNYTGEVKATTSALPAPGNLAAAPVFSTQIDLTWSDNSINETGFRIERKIGVGGSWTQIATVGANVTGYHNTGLTTGTTYYYRTRSYNSLGLSFYSNETNATTP